MSATKLNFCIKLLSGNNVVMVEASGYESEIFMPQILNGRISFQNIIPNRRCCFTAASGPKLIKSARLIQPLLTHQERKPLLPTNTTKSWRMSAGQETRLAPLAFSTPTVAATGKENRLSEQRRTDLSCSQSSTLPIPELARHGVPTPYEVVKDTLVQIPSGIKVIRLYRDPTPGTPRRVGRVVGTNTENSTFVNTAQQMSSLTLPLSCTPVLTQGSTTHAQNQSDFRLPDTPEFSSRRHRRRSTVTNPTQSSLQKQVSPASLTKWRKCITPLRTYSRHPAKKRSSLGSVRKTPNNLSRVRIRSRQASGDNPGKVLPTYMVNPTQAIKCNVKVDVKKRKILIDPKTKITPRSFKKQQKDTSDLKNDSAYKLPKSRDQYEQKKLSAFDMLTNSNRTRCMSTKLNDQFRKGCINKASSTHHKYKLLCTVPPLEHDEQLRELKQRQQQQRQRQENRQLQAEVHFRAAVQDNAPHLTKLTASQTLGK